MQTKITKTFVDKVTPPPPGKQEIHWDSEIKGFGLRVTPERKTYVVQHRVHGKTVRVTLGLHGRMTPDQARRAARETLGEMVKGSNPNQLKRNERVAGVTLREVYAEYAASRKLAPGTRHTYDRAMNGGFKDWRDSPVTAISRDMVLRRFEQLSTRSAAQTNQKFRFLRALLNFAMERFQTAEGEPLIPSNPCNVLKVLDKWHRIPVRDRYVPEPSLPKLFDSLVHDPLDTRHRNDIRDFCACLVLTGCREQEIASLRWSNVNLTAGTLTIPITKNGDSHTLPMGRWLLALMKRRRYAAATSATTSVFVFPADNKTGHLLNHRKGLKAISTAAGVVFTPHDLRRTFATIASEKLGGDRSYFLVARLLNHRKSDVTSRYVQVPLSSLREAMQVIEDAVVQQRPDIGQRDSQGGT
ncbi:integrase family protein [Leptospira sp. 96542]|nr:integrase family protein [Leptospira sp. 96542]